MDADTLRALVALELDDDREVVEVVRRLLAVASFAHAIGEHASRDRFVDRAEWFLALRP